MRTLIARLVVSAIVTIPVFGSTMLMLYPMPNWVQFVLMLPVMLCRITIFRSGFCGDYSRSPENECRSFGYRKVLLLTVQVTFNSADSA